MLSCRNYFHNRKHILEMAGDNRKLIAVLKIKIFIGRLISFRSLDKWAAKTQRCYSRCKNNNSIYVSVPAGRRHYFGEMYKRADFAESCRFSFDGHMWNVPKDYDAYLRNMYGDYTKLPSPEEREEHVILELKFPEDLNGCSEINTQEE